MKRAIVIILSIAMLCLSACGVSQGEYEDALDDAASFSREVDELKAENAALKQQLAEAEEKYKALEKDYNALNAQLNPPAEEKSGEKKNIYVTTDRIRVRATPTTDDANNVIATLDPGKEVVFIRDEDDDWAVVEINGAEVYISKQYITPKDNN